MSSMAELRRRGCAHSGSTVILALTCSLEEREACFTNQPAVQPLIVGMQQKPCCGHPKRNGHSPETRPAPSMSTSNTLA